MVSTKTLLLKHYYHRQGIGMYENILFSRFFPLQGYCLYTTRDDSYGRSGCCSDGMRDSAPRNQLSGAIPETIASLQLLAYVRLDDNGLTGTIPDAMILVEFLF